MNTIDTDGWQVVVVRPRHPGLAEDGTEEILVDGPEDEARRVYADEIAVAADRGHRHVRLRRAGRDVECWPPATGWTS